MIVVDNFADQVTAVRVLLETIEKKDVVVVAADRGYRYRHTWSGRFRRIPFTTYEDLSLHRIDCERLIISYVGHGLVGNPQAIKNKKEFVKKIAQDPIAVACSRILNDFRPLDRIIGDVLNDSSVADKERYYIAALAQYCFRGGVRYEVLSSAVRQEGLKEQVTKNRRYFRML